MGSTAKRIFLNILYFQRLKIRFEFVATNCSKWSPSWPVWRRFGSVLYVLLVFFWSYVDTAISAPLSTDNQIISILWIHARHFFILLEVSNPGAVFIASFIDVWLL